MNALLPFKQLVYDYSGLTLDSSVAEQRLQQHIELALRQTGLDSQRYLLHLQQHPSDLHLLVSQLTVNETYFFRDPEQIRFCVDVLLPRLLHLAGPRPLRILSAGCSSGEEPYSLVMAILDRHGKAVLDRIHFTGGDLDLDILERARTALYSPFSFRGVDEQIRQRFFKAEPGGYRLLPDIASRVRFSVLNLKDANYPAPEGPYDLILFRNVSIYFDRKTRQDIQQKLSRIMQDDAILLPGSSEILANDFDVFQLCEERAQYYLVQGRQLLPAGHEPAPVAAPRPAIVRTPRPVPPPAPVPAAKPAAAVKVTAPCLQDIRQLLAEERYSEAARLLQQHPADSPDATTIQLMQAWVCLNTRDFDGAGQRLQHILQQDPWHLEALLASGLLHKWNGQTETACQQMKTAAYAHANSWLAQYFHGDCLRLCRHPRQARAPLEIAARLLEHSADSDSGCDWLPLAPSPADALFLVKRHLEQLDQQQTDGY